ncbi:TetR/AcrR family transcriptional regulator C-terminal domain-containing protein [Actinoplanes sp. NBRC 101535]|uniref:TetR/AcrR family transcriptional regulator n=1 Tax=Actinoplanes sp. NBRC 101535 TaxID=3032196 RepID=UPI0024A29FC4|nr:TetR/AcrR family transcriptional regulator C-terminal domain-containing protein [Actinoplanes sp. NBRC 101535]GLY05660.1 TetR family transcriptional regulator [Actinoplanes sp. NBRC 101535]
MARGRPPAFTRSQVVTAAIRVADSEGLEAVTMRRIASEIGAGVMSLYTYVPDREHLADLMVDTAAGEFALPEITGDWRADLLALLTVQRELMRAHPWIPSVLAGRQLAGVNLLRFLEHGLRALEPAGLPGVTRMTLLGLFTGFVTAYVTGERAGRTDARDGAEQIAAAVTSGEFPLLAAVLAEGGDPDLDFARIADWVITGLVDRAAAG